MKKRIPLLLLIPLFGILLASCSDSESGIRVVPDSKLLKIMVGNKDAGGKETVTAVMRNDSVVPDLLTLNSAAHSISKIHGWIWIACEGGYVRVVKPSDYSNVGMITYEGEQLEFQYVIPVGDSEVAISDAALGSVFVASEKTLKITTEYTFNQPVGQMAFNGNKLYAAAGDRICTVTLDKLAAKSEIPIPARRDSKLIYDKFGALWALSAAQLTCVSDTTTHSLAELGIDASNGFLECNYAGDKMYFNGMKDGKSSLFEITVGTKKGEISLNETPIFTLDKVENLTNLAMSLHDTFYICDAKDGISDGAVYEYDVFGRVLNAYSVGISPRALLPER